MRAESSSGKLPQTWPMGVYRSIARGSSKAQGAVDGTNSWRRELLDTCLMHVHKECPVGDPAERDLLDAAAAAFAGWCFKSGSSVSVTGRDNEGSITVPAFGATPQ